jgi:transposase InsO family protein
VATTGLRRGELAGLTRGDVDLDGAGSLPRPPASWSPAMPPSRIRRPPAATVIDLCTRMVVGWQLADHMRTSLVIDALQMAITHGHTRPGAIFHSDCGCPIHLPGIRTILRRGKHHLQRRPHRGVLGQRRRGVQVMDGL